MYPGREVFPSPPLALIAAEIRFGHEPLLASQAGLDAVLARLRSDFPLLTQEEIETLSLMPNASQQATKQVRWRALTEDRTASVTVSSQAVVLETVEYKHGYEAFRQLLFKMCAAVAEPLAAGRVWRLGLRYVDEIRLPSAIPHAGEWGEWLAPHLVAGTVAADGAPVLGFHGDVVWPTGEKQFLTMRWGTHDQGSVVAPGLPLKREQEAGDGPLFVLDIDSYWQPDPPPAYTAETVMAGFDRLHLPTGRAFQAALTDRLRDLFRQGGDHAGQG